MKQFTPKWIKERRKAAKLTQKELAEKIGTTGNTVARWEAGRLTPKSMAKKLLLQAFNEKPPIPEPNPYEYLKERALKRAKQGRENLRYAETNFHEALFYLRRYIPFQSHTNQLSEAFQKLADYPATLRAVMDAQDEAHDLLLQMRQYRMCEEFSKPRKRTTPPPEK